jgi:protein involved in polysaccharide export with SLBB domain
MMKDWNSRKIAVFGQVNKPGSVSLLPQDDHHGRHRGGRWLHARGRPELRQAAPRGERRTESATFRVSDISEGRAPNVVLMPRDVLFVEERISLSRDHR